MNATYEIFSDLTQPLTDGQVILLPAKLLKVWSHNPRTILNDDRSSILADLRANGFKGIFEITQEPQNNTHFVPYRGGSTRAELISQLNEEGDSRFVNIPCQFKTWPGTTTMFGQALRENLNRGAMCYIDEALGCYTHLKALVSPALPTDFSSRQNAETLTDDGIKTSHGKVVNILFLAHLYEHNHFYFDDNKNTFKASDLTTLKQQHDEFKKLFKQLALDDHFELSYSDALIQHDQATLNLHDFLTNTLDKKIALLTNTPITDVTNIRESRAASFKLKPNTVDTNNATNLAEKKLVTVTSDTTGKTPLNLSEATTNLHNHVYLAACKVANSVQLTNCILPLDTGYGFQVAFPITQLLAQQSKAWWFLLNGSGLTNKKRVSFINDKELQAALLENDTTTFRAKVGNPLALLPCLELLTSPNEPAIAKYCLELINTITQLRVKSDECWSTTENE
jgi:hypothetical protein